MTAASDAGPDVGCVPMARELRREALLSAVAAGSLAAVLAWLGPPGSDLAAHAYQRALFLQHGFSLWNNFWYAGRYSFVTYSVVYYPLAALFGIRLLAVATVATSALAFAIVLGRQWGATARWSSRTFAVVWAGIVLSAAFPFALGIAFALLSLWALQARRHWRFAALAALTLAASPVAFLLLAVFLAGPGIAQLSEWRRLVAPTVGLGVIGLIEVLLWRAFPGGGRYPFSFAELAPALVYCGIGVILTWRVERARLLRPFFVVYAVACLVIFFVPSAIGENIARMRFAAIQVLYGRLGPRAYQHWLRSLGVRYVVYWRGPVDYSARGEERLLITGRSGLQPVMGTDKLMIYEVPHATPILTGPGPSRVLSLKRSRVALRVGRPGLYRLAVRWSPYWHASSGCVLRGSDGMIRLPLARAGHVSLRFQVNA